MKEAREAIARALMKVRCVVPASGGVAWPVLSDDPDFDELPVDASEGWADGPNADWLTQEAVLMLADAAINAFLSSLEASGLVVVPREATEEMGMAGYVAHLEKTHDGHVEPNPADFARSVWSAMIAATPKGE